jgi:hypothetical protein
MTNWIRMIVSGWKGRSKPQQTKVDRSTLMGMYLTGANQPSESSARGLDTRGRQEGKFSQTRRRG